MAGQTPVQAEAGKLLFPQVSPPGRPRRPGPSNPVQAGAPGAPEAVPGRVVATPKGGDVSRPADTPSCQRGPSGRVLPGRHGDGCPGDTCPGCETCPEQHCATCRKVHATGTCPACLAMARANLDTLLYLVGCLPSEAVNGRHAFHTHEGIPGGDALVMLAPARPRNVAARARMVRPELPNDPRPPLDVLAYWAELWARELGQAPVEPATLGNVASYLDGQLHRIAARPVFPKLADDLARLVHQVENVLHAGYRPEVSRVPCWDCGARLIKVYADDPKRDHWRCPACGELYDRGRYDRAKHDHLASKGAERFVAVSDAIAATGRPEQTVRTWIKNDWVETSRDPGTGRLLVWWPDVRARHLVTKHRRRTA